MVNGQMVVPCCMNHFQICVSRFQQKQTEAHNRATYLSPIFARVNSFHALRSSPHSLVRMFCPLRGKKKDGREKTPAR